MDDYITKPIKPEELFKAVEAAVAPPASGLVTGDPQETCWGGRSTASPGRREFQGAATTATQPRAVLGFGSCRQSTVEVLRPNPKKKRQTARSTFDRAV